MSLAMFLGPRGDPLSNSGQLKRRVRIESPLLNAAELESLTKLPDLPLHTLSTIYPMNQAVRSQCHMIDP